MVEFSRSFVGLFFFFSNFFLYGPVGFPGSSSSSSLRPTATIKTPIRPRIFHLSFFTSSTSHPTTWIYRVILPLLSLEVSCYCSIML